MPAIGDNNTKNGFAKEGETVKWLQLTLELVIGFVQTYQPAAAVPNGLKV
ncbi:hypothetical protein M493_08350 [Geobacillus genomosp. 3]|uniref:Uncharacterized protein n=1 Tax=Geobacillus genomosp. 3 TaxID=1921421 RepID=S5YZ23_GEOG3|nr:hypothetical protein M493_08350 [Geobacillus genomosp. 3]